MYCKYMHVYTFVWSSGWSWMRLCVAKLVVWWCWRRIVAVFLVCAMDAKGAGDPSWEILLEYHVDDSHSYMTWSPSKAHWMSRVKPRKKYLYIYIYIHSASRFFLFVLLLILPPMSPAVPRSRHTSGRTSLTPYGNRGYLFVKTGNCLSGRTVLMALVASWCGLRWLIEQPDGSFLPELPRFQWLFGVVKADSKFNMFKCFKCFFHTVKVVFVQSSPWCRFFHHVSTWVSLDPGVRNGIGFFQMMKHSWRCLMTKLGTWVVKIKTNSNPSWWKNTLTNGVNGVVLETRKPWRHQRI